MRTAEELYSEVIQLRQTLFQCLEFKRILQMIFNSYDPATANESVKKYYPHFKGAHLKYTVFRKIFNEHLTKIEGIDEQQLSKCDEAECSLCTLSNHINSELEEPNNSFVSKLMNEQKMVPSEYNFPPKEISQSPVKIQIKSQNNLSPTTNLQDVSQKTSPKIHKQPSPIKIEPPFENIQKMKCSNIGSFLNVDSNSITNFEPAKPLYLPKSNSATVKLNTGNNVVAAAKASKRMLSDITPKESTFQPANNLNKKPNNIIVFSKKPFTTALTVQDIKNSDPVVSHFKAIPRTNSNQGEKAQASSVLVPIQPLHFIKCRVNGCKLLFRNEDSMKNHCDKDHCVSYKCQMCHKQFSNDEMIQQHLKTHEELFIIKSNLKLKTTNCNLK